MVEPTFQSRSWYLGGVKVLHAKALDDVRGVIVLVDGDRSSFAVTGDVHAEPPRYFAHVRHLKTVPSPFPEFVPQRLERVLLVRALLKPCDFSDVTDRR